MSLSLSISLSLSLSLCLSLSVSLSLSLSLSLFLDQTIYLSTYLSLSRPNYISLLWYVFLTRNLYVQQALFFPGTFGHGHPKKPNGFQAKRIEPVTLAMRDGGTPTSQQKSCGFHKTFYMQKCICIMYYT